MSEKTPARAIPIRFTQAPCIKKPGKKATDAERKEYKDLSKQYNLSTIFVSEIKQLRSAVDDMGLQNKTIIMSVDGSFCNKTCMNINDPRIVMVARCRKDAKLCFQSSNPRKI